MLGVLAVVLCRLLVTCAGVPVGVLDSGVCVTVLAVASFVALRVSLSPPICPYRYDVRALPHDLTDSYTAWLAHIKIVYRGHKLLQGHCMGVQ